ncbi:MAG TPA: DUF664 domain-containing protein [Longimicrobiaceae bacterium]|nr:DUF664 domain-containing protein [Longimicrobiaceae bacterium]
MWTEPFQAIFTRELQTLGREVEAYPDDPSLWRTLPGAPNSGGTLVLHVTGTLRHYIGRVLGHSGYVRDRAAEFGTVGLTRAQLLSQVEATLVEVRAGLARLGSDPDGYLTLRVDDAPAAYLYEILMHLLSHLAYHLGQLDYHRRMVTGESGRIDAVSLERLAAARPRRLRPLETG